MSKSVKVTPEFGIAVRKKAMMEKQIDRHRFETAVYSLTSPYPLVVKESEHLISLGPYPGMDVMELVGKTLTKLGLEDIDDFFYFHGDFPEWANFSVSLK